MLDINSFKFHQYYLSSSGTGMKNKTFISREDAKHAMYEYCFKKGIKIECVEDSKHCKMYSNNSGVTFCINRI